MNTKEKEVVVQAGNVFLPGTLRIPSGAKGIVIFVHGSGSSRFSPRNQYVARELEKGGLATLLFDLLTPSEEKLDDATGEWRFNIQFLADRVVFATEWLLAEAQKEIVKDINPLNFGYFGASTGGGAAIVAAAMLQKKFDPSPVKAVVSRGGRPDLARDALTIIKAPTLLLVGGNDHGVIELNEKAFAKMENCKDKQLKIIPGATHLFEEKGTLEQVAEHARTWFKTHLQQ